MREETICYRRKSIFHFIAFLCISVIILSCGGGGGGSSSSGGGGGSASTYSVSGTVTENGTGLSGVTATLTQGSSTTASTTDSSGNYTFSSLANGSYVVTPSKSSYIFSPASITVTVNGANVTVPNFTAGNGGITAVLSWTANTESDLAGYKAYWGTSPRSDSHPATAGYSDTVDMHNVTSYVISNLTPGVTYYFSITAYDTSANESDLSSEVSKAMP